MEKLICEYKSYGSRDHPEDEWSDSAVINNEKDLLRLFEEVYHYDSSNRGLPIWGHIGFNRFKFYIITYEICNLNHEHQISKKEIERPDYFKSAMVKHNEWYNKEFKPAYELSEKLQREAEEKELYYNLKEKYEKLK